MPDLYDREDSEDVPFRVEKATLSSGARDNLKDSDFALPGRRYPIHDEAHARNALARGAQHATPSELATIRRKVKARYPGIDVSKAESDLELELVVPLIKGEEEGLFYGVVLSPGVRDSQGDVVTAEDIRTAAHDFLITSRQQDVQHSGVTKDEEGNPLAVPVESWIAPQDLELGEPPQTVLKGAWVMGSKVYDPQTRQDIKDGLITGYSIEGTGIRIPD